MRCHALLKLTSVQWRPKKKSYLSGTYFFKKREKKNTCTCQSKDFGLKSCAVQVISKDYVYHELLTFAQYTFLNMPRSMAREKKKKKKKKKTIVRSSSGEKKKKNTCTCQSKKKLIVADAHFFSSSCVIWIFRRTRCFLGF